MNEKKQSKIIDVTFILSTLLCFGPMIYGLIMWEKLPEQMPIHFNAAGDVDRHLPPGTLPLPPALGHHAPLPVL